MLLYLGPDPRLGLAVVLREEQGQRPEGLVDEAGREELLARPDDAPLLEA